jgi:hypothetical protein
MGPTEGPAALEKILDPAGNQNGFLEGSTGSLLTIRFANSHISTLQSTFAPYCFATVTVHISAVTVYERQEMLTARSVILTSKQDVLHDVCHARGKAVAALVCRQLQWFMINVHGKEIVM